MSGLWFERTAASRAASAAAPLPSGRSSASSPPAQQASPTQMLEQRCCAIAGDVVSNGRAGPGRSRCGDQGGVGWVGVGVARLEAWATHRMQRMRCDAGGHALRHVERTDGHLSGTWPSTSLLSSDPAPFCMFVAAVCVSLIHVHGRSRQTCGRDAKTPHARVSSIASTPCLCWYWDQHSGIVRSRLKQCSLSYLPYLLARHPPPSAQLTATR